MLPKQQRLTTKEFQAIFRESKAFNFSHFVVKYKPTPRAYARFAISCGVKISKKAVARNLIRRRLFEAIQACFSGAPKGDYIIIVRISGSKLTFLQWKEEVQKAFAFIAAHV